MTLSPRVATAAVIAGTLLLPTEAEAVRPFVTDDARVVGRAHAQFETWLRLDRATFQHWALVGFGPWKPLELTVGGFHGRRDGDGYSAAGPLLQGKFLVMETVSNGRPGLAIAAGTVAPSGTGAFRTGGWDYFSYVAVTESLLEQERILLHVNVGLFGSTSPAHEKASLTWGLGTQVRVVGGLHFVGEIFSGDPYVGGKTGAGQAGLRHFISEAIQVDGTFGGGLWGDPSLPIWGTVGLRLVSGLLW